MTRNLMAIAAAMAMLGSGYGPPSAQASDKWDGETEEKVRRAREAQAKEREALQQRIHERRHARRAAEAERQRREAEAAEMLRNGIEPTTGRPLSRQRRRALQREGFRFASVDGRRMAETENTGSGRSPTSAVAATSGETPDPHSEAPDNG